MYRKTKIDCRLHYYLYSNYDALCMQWLHMVTTYGDYIWWLHMVTTCGDYIWWLHMVTTCGDYIWWLHMVTTCGDYIWSLHMVTTYGHYIWSLHMVTTYGHYIWWLHMVTTYGHYMWWLHMVTTYGHYIWWLHMVTTYGDYIWWLHMVTTYGHYIWSLHIVTTPLHTLPLTSRALRIWRMQLLSEHILLLKYSSEDVANQTHNDPNSKMCLFMIFDYVSEPFDPIKLWNLFASHAYSYTSQIDPYPVPSNTPHTPTPPNLPSHNPYTPMLNSFLAPLSTPPLVRNPWPVYSPRTLCSY